jgi:acyl carrier protein
MTATGTSSVDWIVRSALAARTGAPAEDLVDDLPLAEAGLDSLDLVELLVSAWEEIAVEYGVVLDATGDSEGLPWMETVGDLVEFVSASAVDAGVPRQATGRCRPPLI